MLESNQYDGNGNRIFTTDARGHTTGFEYDERNLLRSENRPLAAITRFVLDDFGDRIRRADPEGRVTEWSCQQARDLTPFQALRFDPPLRGERDSEPARGNHVLRAGRPHGPGSPHRP